MARTRVEDPPANPNEEPGDGVTTSASEEAPPTRPDKLSKKESRKIVVPAGHRRCVTKAVLRRGTGEGQDVAPGTELDLSDDEFRHFQKTGCVEEVL